MADIFLSYAREDAARAERLAEALKAAGYSVWWDRKLTAGERYSDETEGFLKSAGAVVVLWSREAIRSVWVCDEAAIGRDEGKLVPIAFDGVEPPIGFRQIQALAIDDAGGRIPEASLRKLMTAVGRKLSPDAADPERHEPSAGAPPAALSAMARLPVIAALVAGAALLAYFTFFSPRAPDAGSEMAPGASLTVPPFEVESADASLAGLATGLTHGMRSMLRDRGFDVRGYQYPEDGGDARRFIEKLGVDYVVRGAVIEIGGALLFNVDIVRAANERAVASFQVQEASRTDLAVMRRILDEIAGTIAPNATSGATAPSASEDPDYYVALGLIEDAAGRADFDAARTLFERAIEREPGNADALALYAYTLASIDRYSEGERRAGADAMAAIERAFAAGEADSEAFFARGIHHYVYGEDFARLERAESDLERAVDLDAGNMRALKWLVSVQIQKGDYAEAIEIADRALGLSPDYRDIQGNRISAQLFLGERAEARRALDALLVESPDWAWGRRFSASLALTEGDLDRAGAEVDRAEAIEAVSWNAELMSIVAANTHNIEAARKAIDLHASRSGLDPAWVAYKKAIIGGDVEGAHASLLELAARETRPRRRAQALVASGFMHLYKGAAAPARTACAESASLSEADTNSAGAPGLAETCFAIAAARLGDPGPARALIARFEAARPAADLYRPYWTESLLAALQAETGDKKAALDTLSALVADGWRTPMTALCRHCVHLSVADPRGLFSALSEEPAYRSLIESVDTAADQQED